MDRRTSFDLRTAMSDPREFWRQPGELLFEPV
jgi:hypothetical protein